MADYGLLVKNDSEEIQIDSTYRNLSLDESGTSATITNGNYTWGTYYTRITIAGSSLVPLILIRPDTDRFVFIKEYHKTGSSFDGFDVVTKASDSGALATDIDWKSCRENRAASGENYGLLVYNSSGKLCFDSGKSYFKIYSIHTIDLTAPVSGSTDWGDSETITHSGISNPFYILSPNSFYRTLDFLGPSPPTFRDESWAIGIKKVSSTSVKVGWFSFGKGLLQASASEIAQGLNPTMKLIVCDVT